MDDKITLKTSILKLVLDAEARKIVGKLMRRFETISDRESLKKECKDMIYEGFRDLNDMFLNGKILFSFDQSKEQKKE